VREIFFLLVLLAQIFEKIEIENLNIKKTFSRNIEFFFNIYF
jgi:hypothetical protein